MKKPKEQPKTNLKDITKILNFVIIYESIYKNTNLKLEEIGLLVKLISKAPNFKPTSRKLADILHINIRALNKISKSLQAKGYLKIRKFGKNSEWIINQTPTTNDLKDFSKESILNALYTYQIDIKQLDLLHKLKIIDDRLYIDITEEYAKELIRLAHYNAYEENE